ncbi:MAG: S8 family serine peptidase [Bacteroidales bacterium]|nr:S8 family serine peptidase [Bacteroidales bacterium]
MKYLIIKQVLIIICCLSLSKSSVFAQNEKSDFLKGKLIIKLKTVAQNDRAGGQASVFNSSCLAYLKSIGAEIPERRFPSHLPLRMQFNDKGQKLIDLSLFYNLYFNESVPVETVINKLNSYDFIEYVATENIQLPLFTPNDQLLGEQKYLAVIKAYQGWDIEQGDTNIVIGIVDTGIDIDHPDLINNIKYNYKDPIDGIDNDNDGYIDNFRGWDFGDYDNNPQSEADIQFHGDFVSGIAGASVNNSIGVAGVSFKCKILPVKIAKAKMMVKAFDGLVYAADHNCAVINCSWGNTYGFNPFEQDIINYVTFNRNALVVAACGNEGNETLYYPASYNNVLSVTALYSHGVKKNTSTYNKYVDLGAPGDSIYTTYNGAYAKSGGTSMAAPIVAGCAALVKCRYPQLDALQLGEMLKVTSDRVDEMQANNSYKYKLGYGRVNLFKALNSQNISSVSLYKDSIVDYKGCKFFSNDTVLIFADFINYLNPVSDLNCVLKSLSPYATIIDSVFSPGIINTYQIKNNYSKPFKILINKETPPNTLIDLVIIYQGGGYYGYNTLSFNVKKDYIDIKMDKALVSVGSNGRIGYIDEQHKQGVGFYYNNSPLMYCGGLMISSPPDKLIDCVYSSPVTALSNDYKPLTISYKENNALSDLDIFSIFNDNNAGDMKINLLIKQNVYSYLKDNFIILEYELQNRGKDTIKNMSAGLYFDFDVLRSENNTAVFDKTIYTAYTYSNNYDMFAGIKLLTKQNYNFYALSNGGNNGSVKIYDGFTKAEKYNTLTTTREYNDKTDVSQSLSYKDLLINPYETITIAFSLFAGDNFYNLLTYSSTSQIKYDEIINSKKYTLDGFVCYNNDLKKPLKETDVILKDSDGRIINQTITDINGYYCFKKLPVGIYYVEAKPVLTPNGVNPIDALIINKAFLKLFTIKDDILKIAANVNKDEVISPIDALLVNRYFLSIIKKFPKGDWYSENIQVNLDRNISLNIRCICFGDVNASFEFNKQ